MTTLVAPGSRPAATFGSLLAQAGGASKQGAATSNRAGAERPSRPRPLDGEYASHAGQAGVPAASPESTATSADNATAAALSRQSTSLLDAWNGVSTECARQMGVEAPAPNVIGDPATATDGGTGGETDAGTTVVATAVFSRASLPVMGAAAAAIPLMSGPPPFATADRLMRHAAAQIAQALQATAMSFPRADGAAAANAKRVTSPLGIQAKPPSQVGTLSMEHTFGASGSEEHAALDDGLKSTATAAASSGGATGTTPSASESTTAIHSGSGSEGHSSNALSQQSPMNHGSASNAGLSSQSGDREGEDCSGGDQNPQPVAAGSGSAQPPLAVSLQVDRAPAVVHSGSAETASQTAAISVTPGTLSPMQVEGPLHRSGENAASPAAATSSPDGADPANLPALQSARLLQTASQAEMRVGLQSAQFGSIAIHTTMSGLGTAAQISLEHAGLARELEGRLPQLQVALGSSRPVEVRLQEAATSSAGAGHGGGQSDHRQRQGPTPEQNSSSAWGSAERSIPFASDRESAAPLPSAMLSSSGSVLDLQA